MKATNHFGGLDVAPGCHCRVQWTWCHCWVPSWGAIVVCCPTNINGVDVVPLLGAIVVCYGGEGDQLWGSGRGAIAGEGRSEGDGQVGGVHVVPLEGAIVACYGWVPV